MNIKILVVLVGLLLSPPLFATTVDRSLTISNIGAETDRVYFRVSEQFSGQCLYDVVYLNILSTSGRAQLSVLLTAKALGKKLSILGYNKDTQGFCWASTVELE